MRGPAITQGVDAPKAEQLPVWLKVVHGFGSIAYGVKENGFATFLLLFYNQVVGLDAGVVGAAIMFALISDAFVDPIIGELTDRTKSRWGRRLPWLYTAPIPLAVAWMMLWHPPVGYGDAMTVAWLVGWAIVVRTLVSMCEVPSIAIVPELTGDYDERTVVMRYRFLFGWAGGLLILVLAYGVFFREGGETDPNGYFAYSLSGALLMSCAVLFSALGQHKRIAKPSYALPQHEGGVVKVLGDMRRTLSNRAFLWLVFAALFGFVNQGIAFSMSNYMIGFLWMFDQWEKVLFVVMLFGTMITAFLIVAPLSRQLGKREAAILSGAISLVFNSGLYLAYYLGVFPEEGGTPYLPLVFLLTFLSNTFAIVLMVLSSSMMADVVEASQSETGRRSEGLFFAGYFFMQKCATGIGIFVAGLILSWASFPPTAKPGTVGIEVLHSLAFDYALVIFFIGVLGLIVMRRFPIDRADHEARLAKLDATAVTDIDGSGMTR